LRLKEVSVGLGLATYEEEDTCMTNVEEDTYLGELRLKEVSIGFGLATLLDHAPQHIFKVHLKDPTPGQQFYHVFGITYKKKKRPDTR
jgi:hypothetical protein